MTKSNPYAALRKRGQGMSSPPKLDPTIRLIDKPETSEPLPNNKPLRPFSISTKITEEASLKLDEIRFHDRRDTGTKVSVAEVLEQGIEAIYKARKLGK